MKIDSTSIQEIYNQVIFSDILYAEITLSELVDEMEIRSLNPKLYSEKAFLSLILNLVESYEGRKIPLKEAKNLFEESIKNNSLQKWGEDLIVTKLFFDYKDQLKGENISTDIIRLNNEKKVEKISLFCPYCENTNVQVQPQKTRDEYICPSCNKTFLAIIGTVRGARGLGGYVAHQAVIRIKNIEGGESAISYRSTYQGLEVRSGDLISAIYKKGWLSSGYRDKPAIIQNFNLGVHSKHL